MSGSVKAKIAVAVTDEASAVKISGRANVTVSVPFREVVEGLQRRARTPLYVFLESCLVMDSTFLGVLALQGEKFHRESEGGRRRIVLVSPSERVMDLIDNLGVLDSFEVMESDPDVRFEFKEVEPDSPGGLTEVTRTSLEAHETLIELNEDNRRRFASVTKLLREELKHDDGDGNKETNGPAASK